jgi:hypothetical protein
LTQVPALQASLDQWIEKAVNFLIDKDLDLFDESSDTSLGTYKNLLMEYTNLTSLAFEAITCHEESLNRFAATNHYQPIRLPLLSTSFYRLNSITTSAVRVVNTRFPDSFKYLTQQADVIDMKETLKITVSFPNYERKIQIITD